MPPVESLNEKSLQDACRELAAIDPDLGRIVATYGFPPLWDREPTFATLVHIILEQQVSLASALAAFNKLRERTGEIRPERVLELTDDELRSCYFSRQKSGYVRELSKAVIDGSFDFEAISKMPDHVAKAELKRIKGIGDWTADIYLLMALLRPDVMPKGDLALHVAYKNLTGLDRAPNSDEFQEIAERWRPHRASAARMLWHLYLSERSR